MASTETRSGFRLPWVSDAHPSEDAAQEPTEAVAVATDPIEGDPAPETAGTEGRLVAETVAPPVVPVPPRRPTKFLADLARAMRAAAESERQEILERFQGEAKAFTETIHERSAAEATELRATADQDIAGIRDWSKAEIARIREETERRVTGRRAQLEAEIDAHAGRIERRIEHVHGAVSAFEAEMMRFFETLLVEEDPTRFAALASNLPEPPSLDAVAATLPDVIAPGPTAAIERVPDEVVAAPEAEPEPTVAEAVVPEAVVETATPAEPEPVTLAEPEPVTTAESEPALAPEIELPAAPEPEPADAIEAGTARIAPAFDDDDGLSLDPRVTALGLTPDFDAAEAEAAADLADEIPDDGSGEEVPVIDDETIASRLAGLVPIASTTGETVDVRVVVSGLVSVASIAGFKRGLGHLPGVQSVSVSSGPDGEFVFAVAAATGTDLAESIATMETFSAHVTQAGDGLVRVDAHDPDTA